jgi:hypothetical protein
MVRSENVSILRRIPKESLDLIKVTGKNFVIKMKNGVLFRNDLKMEMI